MTNPYVMPQELLDGLDRHSRESFLYRAASVRIVFETSMDFIAGLLPPFLELPDEPLCTVSIGKDCQLLYPEDTLQMGNQYYDFSMVSFACKYKDGILDAPACTTVVMYLNQEFPIYEGREVWGEAKRLANTQLFMHGDELEAYVERYGKRIIHAKLKLGKEIQSPPPTSVYDVGFKATLSQTGEGFESDPIIIAARKDGQSIYKREATGTFELAGGPVDPLDEIPIGKVRELSFAMTNILHTCPLTPEIFPDHKALLPYYMGKMYEHPRV